MDEEAYFEGYDFTTNGKEMEYAETTTQGQRLNHKTVVVKWTLKFEMGHIGIYGANIQIRSVTAAIESNDINDQSMAQLKLNGFEHVIKKVKNPEVEDIQIFIKGILIDVERKQIHFEFVV